MQNSSEFVYLKRFFETFDWLPITEILGKTRFSRRGIIKDFPTLSI